MEKKYWRPLDMTTKGLGELKIHEFFNTYREFTARIKTYIFTNEYVNMCINAVLAYEEPVDLLRTWKRAHDVSTLIDDLSDKSRDLLIGIRSAVDAAIKFETPQNSKNVRLLANWIKDVRSEMSSNTKAYQIDAVDKMEKRVKADTQLEEALDEFGLSSHFNNISAMMGQMISYRSLRDNDNTHGRDVRDGLRAKILDDMRLALAALEGMAKHSSEDGEFYFEVSRNFEKLLVTACTPQKARATRSKNEKESESDMQPEEGIETTFYSEIPMDVETIQNGDLNEYVSDRVEDENNGEAL